MRRRLEQLLNGKFEYEVQPPILSVDQIERVLEPEQTASGEFTLNAPGSRRVKGFLYSSNPRVTFDPPQFYGYENRFLYQVDVSGLSGGETTEGYFTFCTDLGEYSLPYRFEIRRQGTPAKEQAPVPDVYALADLSVRDVHEARRVFQSAPFARELKKTRPELYLLYQAVREKNDPPQALEEFLLGCELKEPVELSLAEQTQTIHAPARSVKRSVTLSGSAPGWLTIDLTSDSRFLRLEKKRITTDDFVGGSYPLEYIIDINFLHPGMNYGRICVSSCYQTLYLEVTVQKGPHAEGDRSLKVRRMMRRKMLELYLDLRLKRIEMQSWIDRSLNVVSSYKRAGGTDVFADLFLVQLHYANGKKVKANRLLQEIESHPERFTSQEQYAYYLYISTFFERDSAYVDQVEAKILQLFLQQRDSWIIQWILLYLQERYLKDDSARLEAILIQIRYGCSSPIMYLEAMEVLRRDPYLLKRLELPQIKILLFGVKQHMITEQLAMRISSLSLQESAYDRRLFRILTECYEVSPSSDVLGAICTMLIAGDKKDRSYFEWYARGVDKDLRITGLYEYYMETMDLVGIEKMPQIIRMYFSYNNTLNYHKKAAIYRDISDNRDNVPQVYANCRQGIDHFVRQQLSMERIDENLAVLYERFLTRRMLTRTLAQKLIKLLFTFEVTCKNPQMKSVVVVHEQLKEVQEVPLRNGRAKVQIFTEQARILLADDTGRRYASSSLYRARRYLDSPLLITWCRELAPDHPGLTLYTIGKQAQVTDESLDAFCRAQEMESLRSSAREQIRKKILAFYTQHPDRDELYEYLSSIQYSDFIRADKRALMQLLTQEGMYEQAFSLLEAYGAEQIDISCLVRICSQTVLVTEYEENIVLLDYCFRCFQYGKYDDNILTYLLMYYDGPIEEMKKLWNVGHQNDLDTLVLEEKILSLLIFTRTGSAGTERIFASYQSKLGRRKLCKAYLMLKSYEYFVQNLPVSDLVFTHLEQIRREGGELEDVCKLALLQYYAGLPSLQGSRRETAAELIEEYNSRNMRFAFFTRFEEELVSSCQLEDKVFLEYAANPSHRVYLYVRRKDAEEDYHKEIMRDCFEGIFVREFVLFDEERLECYMEEFDGDKLLNRSDLRTITAAERGKRRKDRYALISKMSRAAAGQKWDELEADLENYYQTDYLTQELFTLI